MFQKRNYFHIILTLLMGILTIVDSLIVIGFFGVGPFIEATMMYPWVYAIALALQLPMMYLIVYKSYIWPIEKLNQGVALFHVGVDDEVKIEENSWSKSMNNTISFFNRSLRILKVFKAELHDGRKLRSEVEIAADIQKQSLSKESIIIPGLDIATGMCSASKVGGDSLDIIAGQNGNYYLYVGDVTGHGVASGLVMMMINALVAAFSSKYISGAEILAETNFVLKPRIKQNMMMTAVMLRWDSVNKKLYYTGAGHEFVLIYKMREKKVYKIKTGGLAIGMMKNIAKSLKEQQIAFEPWDLIILYSDGVTEARYRSEQNGMLFGVERIMEAVLKLDQPNPESVFRQITLDLSAFMGYRHVQYDDITLAIVGFTPEGKMSTVTSDIAKSIDASHITEWNWWITQ